MNELTPSDATRAARPFAGALWRNVTTLAQALPAHAPNLLLHAGPPLADTRPAALPAALRQAALQAIVFERLADDAAHALQLLERGEVRLACAQDHGGATPLAQVVSASMPVALVGDDDSSAWAPLVEGPPPALRFGASDASARQRLAEWRDWSLADLAGQLRERPVSLAPIVERALAQGDECHARTAVANESLVRALQWHRPDAWERIAGFGGFVLPILMASAAWALRRTRSGIAAAGGNGQRFGIRMHGESVWRTIASTPPLGPRMPGLESLPALGAIGDSAVIDFCGLGGQALIWAPALQAEWRAFLPADWRERRDRIVDPDSGLVDAARVAATGSAALVNLAILDRDGARGLLGRGVFEAAIAPLLSDTGGRALSPPA